VLRAFFLATSTILLLGASAATAAADEAKTPVSAAMILNIVSAPVSTRTSAYDAGLKDPLARAPEGTLGEVLPDGSVRYGRAIVTVRNPCPPSEHLDLPPLPGRRR